MVLIIIIYNILMLLLVKDGNDKVAQLKNLRAKIFENKFKLYQLRKTGHSENLESLH